MLGFDADPAIRNVAGIIDANPQLALKAVALRRYGQEIIRRVGGRRIHPHWAVPGGVSSPLSLETRDWILLSGRRDDRLYPGGYRGRQAMDHGQPGYRATRLPTSAPGTWAWSKTVPLSSTRGLLRLIDRDGKRLEEFDGRQYLNYIQEHVEDWSYLKFPYYKKMGWPEGVYRVAPLARLNVADRVSDPSGQ